MNLVQPLTLPGLQDCLDTLPPGMELTLAIADCRRLFGADHAGQERLEHFAHGHGCTVQARPSALVFTKRR